ncbi:tandem-95 repeat protein [Microbacterium sp. dk485]|uniref:Ig-like domain-containing protein n=1 Tax=Microbacterium sp. dk485 TaxID=2560021 RepID=UPI0010734EE6|nr:Ig-like domain-containing protein [Microbacterium sp. dk485]TFV84515.1 tandem-95 repeat protein [Microbacterium sp. dk485]
MRSFTWLRRRRRTLMSAGVVTVSAIAVTTMAVAYQGFPTTEVDLHDGGVWITKQSSVLVGHFNHESRVLDAGLRAASDEYDILQEGSTVLVLDQAESTVTAVDPAMVMLTDAADIPAGAKVALGGPTMAVLDPASGSLWVAPARAAGAFTVEGVEPVTELGKGADVAVGRDGTVYGVSAESGEIVTVPVTADGETGDAARRGIEGVDENAELSITVVGTTAAVLDADTGTVHTTGGLSTEVDGGESAVLQQPAATGDALVLATASDVVRVPFDGAEPSTTPSGAGEGAPTAPVTLAGCTYAAWSGSGAFVRDCSGDANDLTMQIEDLEPTAQLRFRQNRDVVILNDVVGGAAWMATDAMQRVDNWDDIIPPEGESEEDEQTTEETVETTLPERTEVNTPPIAVDDDLGVRPGRTTVLPVLDNDTDADGDILVVTLPDGEPGLGEVQPIHDGSALQIAVPEDGSGSETFRYEIDDGRGGTDTANVRLNVRGWDVNAPPEPKRVTTVVVEAGGAITYNVLPDWTDPDGDEIFLASVVPAEGDEADFTADGRITYRAIGGTQGRKDVPIIVSDGSEVTEGIVRFDVRPAGSTVPVTNADHVVVRAGQSATVAPLSNDTSSGRETLRLTRVDEVPGAEIVPDYPNKTFTFRSSAPGTYYAQYLVAAGPNAVPGLVRIDVLPDADTDLPPVAVRDVALLPSGADVLVNVLANDSDPSGGILVVQSVTVDPSSGISVAVIGHETLRITDQSALSEQTRISYRISNGQQTAEGEVVVIPVPAPDQLRPPVASDDTAVVRAGDVVTIPVLDNDYHPNNDTLRLAPDLVEPVPTAEEGTIFVSQDTVRFRASDEPGTVYATYEVEDSTGQKDAGYVTIQVLPVDADTNQAPRPRDITGRVLAGSEVRIPVPLDGLDPDGDSVELMGIDSAPSKGRVSEVGANFLTYEAFEGETGPDAFTYRVRDRFGAKAIASIRVGIAPAEAANQAPYAVKDAVVMRPGREVAVPVLANDSDPEGDALTLVSDGLIMADSGGLEARVLGDRVVVTSPGEPVETSLQYTIRDARGAEARAVLQVTVAEDVPLQRPIARDDRVRPSDVEEEDSVDLDLLANDEDPDGTVDALEISVDAAGARVLEDGVVRLPILEEAQLVTYTITDRDDLTASAFIHVPGLRDLPPVLISTEGVEVQSGETISIPLSEHVRAAGDRDVVITEAGKVSATHANGAPLVEDEKTLVYTSADGYFGQDAITFEVTDGTGPDDPEGRKATLTLPVTVLPPDNQQPTFVNGQMDVAPGEDATGLDLVALTTDPDEGDLEGMRYTIVGGSPSGMNASVDGQTLRVSADADTRKGTTAEVQVRIDDGETDPIEGTVTVRVTASTRPLPTANDDVLPEADQGRTISVPVLANDFNPFPETPLKVVAAATETGEGVAEVSGDQVSVTPSASFFGTMVVRYRIQDATADVDREVEGRIRLTVQGKPDAPGVPTVSSVQDRTVVLSWTPPPNNGAPITGYTVTSTAGNYTRECPATTCTLSGLTNNVEYNFVVTATNRVGESDPSAPSETARPDARPDTPAPPTLRFGDRSLNVAWTTPSTPGSPVESFTLEISPAPPSGVTQKTASGNSLVWEGLENGTAYQVRVQAHNRAPEPSSWSAYSATEIPAGPPTAPGAPSTTRLDPVGSQAQLQVSWAAPNPNGDAISGYRLNVLRGGSVINTISVGAGQTSQAVVVEPSRTDYSFTVAAVNKAGWGPDSAPSAPRRAFTPPGAPQGVSASTPGPDNSIHVAYQPAETNGADPGAVRYEYKLNGGGWAPLNGTRITSGISNGSGYTVTLRAVTTQDGTTYASPDSNTTAQVIPYGPIQPPGASARGSGTQIEFGWSPPAANGRAITKLEIKIAGGGWEQVAVRSGSRTVDFGYDQNHTIQVRATDAANQTSTASAQARTAEAPKARAWVTKGSRVNSGECSSASCAYFELNTSNFPAGSYNVVCVSSRSGEFAGGGRRFDVPRSGSIQLGCFYGYPDTEVWVRIDGWGNSERYTWR